MSMIPVDLRLAKMLVLATIFKCLDPSTFRFHPAPVTSDWMLIPQQSLRSPLYSRQSRYSPRRWINETSRRSRSTNLADSENIRGDWLMRRRARESFVRARSDLMTDVQAFDQCTAIRTKGGSHSAVRTFCDTVRAAICKINPQRSKLMLFWTELHQPEHPPRYYLTPARLSRCPDPTRLFGQPFSSPRHVGAFEQR